MDSKIILVTFFIKLFEVQCQSGDEVKRLLDDLSQNYNKNVRPSKNQSISLDVDVSLFLVGINDLDEVSEKFSITGFLEVNWIDEYLSWDPSDYDNIVGIHYPQNSIWKPDLSLKNGVNKMKELGSSFVNAYIGSDGHVSWHPYEVFDSRCSVDITTFPFDQQTCDLVFVCWNYDISEVNLLLGGQGIEIHGDLSSNTEWTVVRTSSVVDAEDMSVIVIFSITIKRKTEYFILNVIIPVVLLSVLNIFTFVIPCDSGERISYAITVWLSFAVYLSVINSALPHGSNSTSRLAIYIITQLFLNTVVVLITTAQLRIHGYPEKNRIPTCLKRIAVLLKKRRAAKVCAADNISTDDTEQKDEVVYWKDIVSSNDFVLFWCFLIIVLIVTLVCFCSL